MYHCHIHFYLTGYPCRAFEIIKEMPPLEHFTHEFVQSEDIDGGLASEADVILVNLQNVDVKEAVRVLALKKKEEAELILLADKNQILFFADELSEVEDRRRIILNLLVIMFQISSGIKIKMVCTKR